MRAISGASRAVILVVDDDVLVRALLRERLGPSALCVSSAADALEVLHTHRVDALVLAIEGGVEMPAPVLEALGQRAPGALRVFLTDRLDRRGASVHRLADSVWPRTMLDIDRLVAWLDDELGEDTGEADARTTSLLPRPLDAL